MIRRARALAASPMIGRGLLLVLNQGLSAVLGVVYWVLAARLYDEDDLGRQAAVVSMLMFLAYVSQLGLKSTMTWYLPTASPAAARRFVRNGYLISATLAVLIAGAAVVFSTGWSDGLLDSTATRVGFVLGAVVWCVFAIQDGVLTGLRMTGLVPVENTAFNVLKLVLMLSLVVAVPATGIFWSWILPLAPCVLAINWLIARRMRRAAAADVDGRQVDEPVSGRRTLTVAGLDFVGGAASEAAARLLPVIVLVAIGSASAAHFTQAWTLSATLFLVASSLTASMTVETAGAGDGGRRDALAMRRILLAVIVPLAAILFVSAPLVLRMFGAEYAASGVGALRLLALAAIPGAITVWGVGVARARREGAMIAGIQLTVLAVTLGVTMVAMPSLDVLAPALGWLLAQLVAAAIVLVRSRVTARRAADRHDVAADPRSADGGRIGQIISAAASLIDRPGMDDRIPRAPGAPCSARVAVRQVRRGRRGGAADHIHVGIPRRSPRVWLPLSGSAVPRRTVLADRGVPSWALGPAAAAVSVLGAVGALGPSVRTPRQDGDPDVMVLAGGERPNNKLIGMSYVDGRRVAVVKFARAVLSTAELANERDMLRAVPAGLRAPSLLAVDSKPAPTWLAQEPLEGESGSALAAHGRMRELANGALSWSVATAEVASRSTWSDADTAGLVDRVRSAWGDRPEIDAADRLLRSAVGLPAVLCHGDFTPWNVVTADGELRAFDWESGRLRGTAGADLVYFLHTAACEASPGRDAADVQHDLIAGTGPNGQLFREMLGVYASAIGIPVSLIPAMRAATWLYHAALEADWRRLIAPELPADGGHCLGLLRADLAAEATLEADLAVS